MTIESETLKFITEKTNELLMEAEEKREKYMQDKNYKPSFDSGYDTGWFTAFKVVSKWLEPTDLRPIDWDKLIGNRLCICGHDLIDHDEHPDHDGYLVNTVDVLIFNLKW